LFFLRTLICIFGSLLSKKNERLIFQGTTFECGVNVLEFTEVPISIRFFILTVIFLIFDVELVLLIPFILYFFVGVRVYIRFGFVLFLLILLLGVFVE
jgi:NADH-ubiquinone oxidoreductase chain 3